MTKNTKCTNCGLCRKNCPVFRVTFNESDSPRGKAIIIKNQLSSDHLLKCTLCGNCKKHCPVKIDLEFIKIRSHMIGKGKISENNKKMMENIRKHGNPFGKPEKGKVPKDLYCC